jgi:3'-phosphoadenosine 5'-phosphosulfate sulfotransferase (PAPS reductase)/FAD synthetase
MNQKHNIVSVSGGKDSTALLLLAIERETENLQAVFADTGHEHPQTYDYVRYLEQATGVPIRWVRADFSQQIARKSEYVREKWPEKGVPQSIIDRALAVLEKGPTGNPFLDLCIWKGRMPSTKARFCSEELKRNPIIEQVQMPLLDQGDTIWSWQGVRADESLARRDLPELDEVGGGLWNYRPILKWTAEECFAMHSKHEIEHNPLYEQGMGRVGCMPCIHARKDELLEISKRFPEEIERVAEWERIVAMASKHDVEGTTFFTYDGNRGKGYNNETYERGNIYQMVEWAKTSRGGKQYDFFRAEETGPLCSSIYGLCE